VEDLLQNMVDTGNVLSTKLTDALLKYTDVLRKYTDDLREGKNCSDHFSEAACKLLAAWPGKGTGGETPSVQTELPDAADPDAADKAQPLRPEAATPGNQPAAAPAGISEELRRKVAERVPEGLTAAVGDVQFQPKLPMAGLKARLIYDKLTRLGEVCHFDPPVEDLEDEDLEDIKELDRASFGVITETPPEVIGQRLKIGGVEAVAVEPLSAAEAPSAPTGSPTGAQESSSTTGGDRPKAEPPPGKAAPGNRGAADGGTRPAETLRVDIERLDQLMNLSGQLVINKARFSQIGDSLKSLESGKQSMQVLNRICQSLEKMAAGDAVRGQHQDLQSELESLRNQARRMQADLEIVRRDVDALGSVRTSVNDLFETIHQLNRVSDNIQQTVMDTRMLPIGPLFARFKRVIRDITRANGGDIRLLISGEKTELDKRMIDELSDPLIHIVRNAADHGIELPEVRQSAGKPRQGTVTLDAFHRGNTIVIQVTDDGKGLDPDAIRRKALAKGIITESDAEQMTLHQIYQLVWEPGLSTAQKVTEVSGRGMGMDIVKSKIEGLNGVVDLDSQPGKGTSLTIKLPLTLAILPSLMIEIGGDIFALPLESVVEIVNVAEESLATVYGQWTARVRGRVVSLVRLDQILTFHDQTARTGHQDLREATLVIIAEEGCEIGLAVDRVLGEEDIVIKSMAENYRNVGGIAGASILGNGRVSLILDVVALIDTACQNTTVKQSASENES
jgi:two-component system chemotaxis sensor kinase CheA